MPQLGHIYIGMAQPVHKLAQSELHLGQPQLSYLKSTGHSAAGETQAQQHKRPTITINITFC